MIVVYCGCEFYSLSVVFLRCSVFCVSFGNAMKVLTVNCELSSNMIAFVSIYLANRIFEI